MTEMVFQDADLGENELFNVFKGMFGSMWYVFHVFTRNSEVDFSSKFDRISEGSGAGWFIWWMRRPGSVSERCRSSEWRGMISQMFQFARRIWIISPEMFLLPMVWFLSQALAAPSLTAEQMDMGVVSAYILLTLYTEYLNIGYCSGHIFSWLNRLYSLHSS